MSGEWLAGGFALGGVALGSLGTFVLQRADRIAARELARIDVQRDMTADVLLVGREYIHAAKSFVIFVGTSTDPWEAGKNRDDYGATYKAVREAVIRSRLTITDEKLASLLTLIQAALLTAPDETSKLFEAKTTDARRGAVLPILRFFNALEEILDALERTAIAELAEPDRARHRLAGLVRRGHGKDEAP